MNFLKREDVVIYSEYFNGDNHVYGYTDDPDEPHDKNEYLWTPEQFMNMALNWGKEDGWSGREYEEYEYDKSQCVKSMTNPEERYLILENIETHKLARINVYHIIDITEVKYD